MNLTTLSRYEQFAARARAIETREDRKYKALQKSLARRYTPAACAVKEAK